MRFRCGVLGAAMVASAGGASAVSVAIMNAGFETDVTPSFTNSAPTGWSLSGSGGGSWNINDAPLGFWTSTAPEGKQIGWIAPAPLPGASASLSQTLSDVLIANSVYTLAGSVGHPIGFGSTPNPDTVYAVELYAGINLLASTSGTGPEGSFTTFSLNFDSTGSVFVGQTLSIRLSSNQPQTGWDAISLDYTVMAVPTPMAASLGIAGWLWCPARAAPAALMRRIVPAMKRTTLPPVHPRGALCD